MTHSGPWRLKEMLPAEVRERLARRPTLLVPVGTTEQHGPHLPLGADTIIVERLTDDLSARLGVVRAPTLEYGVNAFDAPVFPGSATLKRKTLHRLMNELIDSWETGAGVRDFLVLTAQGHEPHQEALATIRVNEARLRVVDVFAMDFGDLLSYPDGPVHGGELDTSLLLHLAPDLVRLESPPEAPEAVAARGRRGRRAETSTATLLTYAAAASARKGERLYRFILDRITSRCFADGDDDSR